MDSYKNSYKIEKKELNALNVHNTGYQKCLPNHQWGPGIRDHFLLHHIISGKGYYKHRNRLLTLSAGDTFLIFPFEEVTYFADNESPWEYAWVGFTGLDATMLLEAAGFSMDEPIIHQGKHTQHICRQLIHIYEARGSELFNAVEMTGRLYTLFSGLLSKENTNLPISITSLYDTYAQKGMEFIHSHYSYPISIPDISEYVGISRSHLFRAFQTTLNQSPKEYLTHFRINQARILLEHSSLSITAIGRSVGFDDNLNFSKAFKKVLGISPVHYKKTIHE
ncbi:MAG: helix-turn-helix domain-containing protein [Lachnospiraceae bacterium]